MKYLSIILLFITSFAIGQGNVQIKFNINNDPVTGDKVKIMLTGMTFDQYGKLNNVSYILKLTNPADDSDLTSTSEIQGVGFFSKEINFQVAGKSILSTTKVYSPLLDAQGVAIPNAVTIGDYLQTKNINAMTNPNASLLAGSDASYKFVQAMLYEIILIKRANGQLP